MRIVNMLCKVPVHSFKVNYNIVRSIKDYIENRTTLKLAEILERIWKMRIWVVNAYTELCNDSNRKNF